MDKFKNKYRIPSARHPHWDYRWAGAYFITICTQNRIHYFGEIQNGVMNLSNVGVIADILWHEIPHHAKNVELGAFVVMPNHIHGILILTGNDDDHNVETGHALSLPLYHQRIPQRIYQRIYQRINQRTNQPKSIRLKKPSDNNVFKILAKIPFHPLWVPTNLPLPNTPIVWDLNLHGKPVFTTTSFVMKNLLTQYQIISSIIL